LAASLRVNILPEGQVEKNECSFRESAKGSPGEGLPSGSIGERRQTNDPGEGAGDSCGSWRGESRGSQPERSR